MPKQWIQRWLPSHEKVRDHHQLRWLGTLLHDPNLWHLNRRSVSGAFFVGIFCAFLPLPFQMVLAALIAMLFRVNLPLSSALVWITNPLTIPPIFFATYKLGTLLLGTPVETFAGDSSWEWIISEFQLIWRPLLLGSLICGLVSGAVGYVTVRSLWRLHIVRRIQERRQAKRARNHASTRHP